MKTFLELEEDYGHIPATVCDPDWAANGSLELNGRDSLLRLASDRPLPLARDESGWFQISLQLADGTLVLLHNALETHSTTHFGARRGDGHNEQIHIFPNLLLFGADALAPDLRVGAISFRLKGLGKFFYYRQIEHFSTYQATPAQLRALREMRRPNVEHDFFRPSEVYVQHRLPRLMKIQVGNCFYEVYSSGRMRGPGFDRIDVTTWPAARIRFGTMVTIDEALDHAFGWRRYFQQMTLMPMPFEAMSLEREGLRPPVACDVYAPTMMKDADRSGRTLGAWEVPLNAWSDRSKARRLMQSWLETQPARETFRSLLNGVVEQMARRTNLDDIVRLCAAVESLDELATGGPITREMIAPVAAAAVAEAGLRGLPLPSERISGVLGGLTRPSLAHRFDRLTEQLPAIVDRAQARTITRAASRLRQTGAHAQDYPGLRSPMVGPVTAGLASLLALFDLTTCGLDSADFPQSRLSALSQIDEAAARIGALAQRGAALPSA